MSISIENLNFYYGQRQVLQDISFESASGSFLSVLGPNGVGKSTLFRCMLGLLKPTSGKVLVNGKDVQDLNARELAGQIAYIPQSHSPIFNYTVFDMVLMGTTAQCSGFSSPGKEQKLLAEAALERLGILSLKERPYGNISGGERQLCLIARALAQQAKVLVMDEPSTGLDLGNRIAVMETIRSLVQEGYAVIQSTHDPEQAYLYSDRILALHEGKILSLGSPQEVITSPLISTLYGVNVQVRSMDDDKIRVCVPTASRNSENKEE